MTAPSRHSRRGGDAEKGRVQAEEITPYEVLRNRRSKALHDEVQRALVDSGFGEAAELRPLFTGELAEREGSGGATKRKEPRARRDNPPRQEDLQLRRSARNVAKENANIERSPILTKRKEKVREEFFTWPRNTMPKRRSSERSPVKKTSKSSKNLYEDSDSERSEHEVFRSRDGRGSAFEHDAARRQGRRREDDYSSEDVTYNCPPHDLRRERRSPHGGGHADYHGKGKRPDRHQEGPSNSRYGRGRSPTAVISHRESRVREGQGRRYNDIEGRQSAWNESYSPTRSGPNNYDRRVRIKRSRSTPPQADELEMRARSGGRTLKKPVEVDALGIPVGLMKDQFSKDINSFVKDMNPCVGYEKQKQKAKDRLHDRIYDDYEVHGEADRVDEKYIKKCATKALITWRHTLNKALDSGDGKPPELSMKHWEELQTIRQSEESKRKSQQMGNQARNRGLRNTTKEKIKQAVLVKLTLQLNREPYQTEVDDAVEKEIAAVILKNDERKKRKGVDDSGAVQTAATKGIQDRLLLLEDSIEKFDDRMDVWGSMLSKLYEAQFGKNESSVRKERQNEKPVTQEQESGDSDEGEDSGDRKRSVHSSHGDSSQDNSSDGSSSEEDDEITPSKAAGVPATSGNLKEKQIKEAEGEAAVASTEEEGGKAGTGAGPSEPTRNAVSTMEKMPKAVATAKPSMKKPLQAVEPPPIEKTASEQKESETGSGRAPKKDSSIQQEITTTEVKGSEDKNVKVKDRRATRNATAAIKEKAEENQTSSMETVRQKLTNEDAACGKIVLMEDSDSDSYVAIGEVMASDYTLERIGSAFREGGHQIRVTLKTVTKPDTVLPFKIHDDEGRVLCRTLGEAFLKKKGVNWLISDTVLTGRDGCTVRTWA